MRNRTNLIKYRLWAPLYDLVFADDQIKQARRRIFELVDIQPGQKVLLVGVGTGQDLPFIQDQAGVTGIDLSPAMLAKAQEKAKTRTSLLIMNAENLSFAEAFFDVVVMNLILSVVENPRLALGEAVRVLKPGGKIIVFDKFVSAGVKPGRLKLILNFFTTLGGTDITRSFEEIAQNQNLDILKREDSIFGGQYQIILLQKRKEGNLD